MIPEGVTKKILCVAKVIDASLNLDDSAGQPLNGSAVSCKSDLESR